MTAILTPALLPRVQAELKKQGLDGWLLYDFRGLNSIAGGLLGVHGFATRRMRHPVWPGIAIRRVPRPLRHA